MSETMSRVGTPAPAKQAGLWLLEEFVPGSGVNNLSFAFRVEGALDRDCLQGALTHLLRRFQVLRMVFHKDGTVLCRSFSTPEAMAVTVESGTSDGPVLDVLSDFVARPFHTDGGSLLRALVLPDAEGRGDDVFCVALHHSVCDVQSTTRLLREFVAAYDILVAGGRLDPPVEVPIWQEPAPSPQSERYWRDRMRGFDSASLALSCERAESAVTTLTGDAVVARLSPEARDAVRRLQREVRAPESVVLLAAYFMVLAAHGAGPDIVVGSPVSSRTKEAAEAVGYHTNVVTLRQMVDGSLSFKEFAGQTRRMFMEAMEHVGFSADELLEVVDRSDSAWRNLLFRHCFNYVPFDPGQTSFAVAGRPARPPPAAPAPAPPRRC
jgi:hypothetical protein